GPFTDPTTGQVLGIANRTSYLMNSQLSHKSRRYGHWDWDKFVTQSPANASRLPFIGTANFIDFVERDAAGIVAGGDPEAPKQDDFDCWLGANTIKPWIAYERHSGSANYLYLDDHVATLKWDDAVGHLFPDGQVLTQDGTYMNETGP